MRLGAGQLPVLDVLRHRLLRLAPGDELDLGGTSFQIVEATIKDGLHTCWGFDSERRVLFPGDGFAYSHFHEDGHCGRLAEEAPTLKIPDMTALFADIALYWTRFADLRPYCDRLEAQLFDELKAEVVAPTHGLPIADLPAIFPLVREGLLLGSSRAGEENRIF